MFVDTSASPYRTVCHKSSLAGTSPWAGSATPPVGRPGALPGVILVAWSTNFTWILGLGLLLLILLLFPDGHLPTRRWRPLAWLILLLAVALPLEGEDRYGAGVCQQR
jgi:hypothetical protein